MLYKIAAPIIQPRMRFFYADGKPLVGGKVYSYKVGTDLFKPTYRDAQRTALNQNPVVLDNEGSALIYLLGSHVLKVYDKNGNFREQIYVPESQMTTQFFDKFGKPLSYGKVWTYDIASTIKKTSFSNADQSKPNPNPIILDAEGKASISMIGSYRLRTYNEKNVHLGDQDFQRPVARALTSKIYPIYFEDFLESSISLNKLYFGLNLSESVSTDLAIDNARLSDIITYTSLDAGREDIYQSSVTITSASLKNTLSYITLETTPEPIQQQLNIVSAKLQQVLISTSQQENLITQPISIVTAILG